MYDQAVLEGRPPFHQAQRTMRREMITKRREVKKATVPQMRLGTLHISIEPIGLSEATVSANKTSNKRPAVKIKSVIPTRR